MCLNHKVLLDVYQFYILQILASSTFYNYVPSKFQMQLMERCLSHQSLA